MGDGKFGYSSLDSEGTPEGERAYALTNGGMVQVTFLTFEDNARSVALTPLLSKAISRANAS